MKNAIAAHTYSTGRILVRRRILPLVVVQRHPFAFDLFGRTSTRTKTTVGRCSSIRIVVSQYKIQLFGSVVLRYNANFTAGASSSTLSFNDGPNWHPAIKGGTWMAGTIQNIIGQFFYGGALRQRRRRDDVMYRKH